MLAYLLLAVAQVLGLVLVAFGLPGLWVQVAALALFGWLGHFQMVGFVPIALVLFLAIIAEIAEFLLGGHFARKYGGSRRAARGAILGGMVGALIGLPLPLLGSILGAMVGAFAGALALELTTGRGAGPALRVGWGAFLGRTFAIAMKAGVGVVILVFALLTAAQ